ncbi:MAG: TetR family transcriptional regulator [Actinomycetota bacterium]
MDTRPIGQRSTKWHEDKAKATKSAVLRGAAKVFDEVGFRHAVVSAISKSSATTPGAMYHYFSSKEEIAQAVITEARSKWRSGPTRMESSSPLVRLIDDTRRQGLLLQNDVVVRAGFRLAFEPDPIKASVATFTKPWLLDVEESLREASAVGELGRSTDGSRLAWNVVASFVGVFILTRPLAADDEVLARLGYTLRGVLSDSISIEHRERALAELRTRFAAPPLRDETTAPRLS